MNKEQEQKVTEIIINQDKQIDADINKIVLSLDKDVNYEELKKILTKRLLDTGKYKIQDIEKRIEELKKYSETFRKEIEKEKERKQKKLEYELKAKKAINAYEGKETYLAQKIKSDIDFIEEKKTIIQCVVEYITGKNKQSNKEINKTQDGDEQESKISYKSTLQERIAFEAKRIEHKNIEYNNGYRKEKNNEDRGK